jgi:hypothetical protein
MQMATDNWQPKAYGWEEFLSFDRLKRAVTSRVLDWVEHLMETEFPVEQARIEGLVAQEWQRAKETLRTSPQAKEAFRKWLESYVNEHVDRRLKADKSELEQFGVAEKSL